MRKHSLVPRLKIMVIDLGVRLVHERNRKLTSGQAWSLPVVVGKACEHHMGKALHQLPTSYTKRTAFVNCKGRMVSSNKL